MDVYWDSIFRYSSSSPEHPYLPDTKAAVYILGQEYCSLRDREKIRVDIQSLPWMTYRKGFSPIGSRTGPTSDSGWGCMHRCGQMMLAFCLERIHLGAGWRWHLDPTNATYWKILRLFEDRKSALYSIQTISLMGISEGKPIGQWFGPNTVAQVLK
ncbi:unnamed protein product [Protopolystoma xenopodis]|uniref:Cysteine protease n=1 Tax=Protopolystoma xenopodis TaxID=117903 RepID=A0A3S5CQ08_9PLAT|nr:unnamed protein product [Protopolystoma xenopodis]